MKKILFVIILSTLFCSDLSIIDKKNLAKTYYEAELYEDAIIILEEVLEIEKKIFSDRDIQLLDTITKLYELNYFLGNFEIAKIYLQEYINIQSSYLLEQQALFTKPLSALKEIYINEKEPELIYQVDSLLNILNSNTNSLGTDSLNFLLPKLIINKNDDFETEYSISDLAFEKVNNGLNLLNNNLYTEAILNLNNALDYDTEALDIIFFKDLDFKQEKDSLYNILKNNIINNQDSINNRSYFYLGLIDYKNKNYENSINHFNKYHSFHPEDINSLLFISDILMQQEQWLDASLYLSRCLKINKNNFFANLAIAECLSMLKDYKESNNVLKYISKKNKNNYKIIFYLGYNNYYLKNYDQAIKYLTQSLLLESKEYLNYYYLGLSYIQKKLNKQALDAFKKCVIINPDFGIAHYELGNLYMSILNEQLAIKHFEHSKRNYNIDDLNYKIGMLYYKNELYLKAMSPLKEYLLNNLNDIEVLETLGNILINIERHPEAINIYLQLIEYDSDNEFYYNNLANSYYKLDDFDNALENYKKIIELNEENYEIYLKIGLILNKQNLFFESEKFLVQALDCNAATKNLLIQLGIAYGGQKKFLQSLLAFKKALKFSLEDPIIHYQLAVIYKELDIYDLAIDNFLFYLKNNEKDDIALYLIGECYYLQQNFNLAIKYYSQALAVNNNIKSLYNIGLCYEKINDNKNAAKYFKNVIKQNPDHVNSREKLIKLYLLLNKSREAKKECEIIYMLDRSIYNSIEFCNK